MFIINSRRVLSIYDHIVAKLSKLYLTIIRITMLSIGQHILYTYKILTGTTVR